jgi:hypothetical protein
MAKSGPAHTLLARGLAVTGWGKTRPNPGDHRVLQATSLFADSPIDMTEHDVNRNGIDEAVMSVVG